MTISAASIAFSREQHQTELQRKLAKLHNRHTLYELVLVHPDGRRYLVAYSARKGRAGIMGAARNRPGALTTITGADSILWGKLAVDGGIMGAWSIRFSGRTQRDSYIEGEITYIGDVVADLDAERFDGLS